MSHNDPDDLSRELYLARRELEMILAIDRIRDTSPDPTTMLANIVDALIERFDAEVGFLCLVSRDNGEMELKIVRDKADVAGNLSSDAVRLLAEAGLL